MATVTNSRLYQWIAESYDSGPGNLRTYNFPPNGPSLVQQQFAPFIQSISFAPPYTTASQWFTQPLNGEAFIRNRCPYWLTVTCTMLTSVGTTTTGVDLVIPPFQIFFLPSTVTAITNITGQDIFDGNQAVATTGGIQTLYFDYVSIY